MEKITTVGRRLKNVRQDFDLSLGAEIRAQRLERGMSQARLGAALGVSFQQIQKYESGQNRVSAAHLRVIAEVLEVSPLHFYGQSADHTDDETLVMIAHAGVALRRMLLTLEDPAIRRQAQALIDAASDHPDVSDVAGNVAP